MKRRQNNWYVVKEDRARFFEAQGFPIKQKANGKWMVLCHPSALTSLERDRKGMSDRLALETAGE